MSALDNHPPPDYGRFLWTAPYGKLLSTFLFSVVDFYPAFLNIS